MNQSQFRKAGFISLDTATLVIKNVSINFMVEQLMLKKYEPSSFKMGKAWATKVAEAFTYDLNGVRFFISQAACSFYRLDPEGDDIFDFKFDKISINFSGTGMKFLRHHFDELQLDVWFDDWLLHFPALIESRFQIDSHFTRLDFAVDFVNDFSNIVGNVVQHLNYGGKLGTPGQFVTSKSPKPYKCQINASERGTTVYIGASTSDQRLRIYDKYGESTDEHGVWLPGKAPEFSSIDANDIHNWVRFELVLRNKKALEFTPETVDSPSALQFPEMFVKIICEKFLPAKTSIYCDWWMDFWQPIKDDPSIIVRDLHFVQLPTPMEKAVKHVGMCSMKNITAVLGHYGVLTFLRAMQRYLIWMQRSNTMDSGKSWLSFKRLYRNSGLDFEDDRFIWSSKYDAWILEFPEFGEIVPLDDEYIRTHPEILPMIRTT